MPLRTKRKADRDLSTDEEASDENNPPKSPRRRKANVYDAVAGRISSNGFVKDLAYGQQEAILAPEEALFKSIKAPERFQEDDFYWADRHLPPDSLPGSDLLEAIHVFASDHYQYTTLDHGYSDTKSLDGSALLALGILLEESARGVLGETGDMAFVEGQPIKNPTVASGNTMDVEQAGGPVTLIKVTASSSRDSSRRTAKRRRL
ncbi:MAG: hypothetical protein GOMPHAMPRED_001764 [Gomphillus americanus]|uniref:Uncharacterized protein n=1 Tax=Gomphillus americanus TaxID=1940652 RepID=A0A8H3F7X6_9LECA|nr:MAG: hypothetical protein GOMPHAMPRED_001764 [Gomphillus americanus]